MRSATPMHIQQTTSDINRVEYDRVEVGKFYSRTILLREIATSNSRKYRPATYVEDTNASERLK